MDEIIELYNNFEKIRLYCNYHFNIVSQTYSCSVIQIDDFGEIKHGCKFTKKTLDTVKSQNLYPNAEGGI